MLIFLIVLFIIVSIFLIYQGLCFYSIIKSSFLVISKFTSNNTLSLVRVILGKYSLVLGLIGIVLSVILLIGLSREDNKAYGSFWVLLVMYVLIALFTVI